eukprot:CAMPEP_0196576392 /NCGR_PEP_ID=MMETSP1081-20130531/5664_1 /TAXON_ID=36882 /ORGANISM="Pyramimonas amylifera, Strain CCMP720" /LENGTH=107 /DNA_ID=CAMNT_0041894981 /DNA_START=199 /DNA_END=518 /DNA_ORIENTATION=-
MRLDPQAYNFIHVVYIFPRSAQPLVLDIASNIGVRQAIETDVGEFPIPDIDYIRRFVPCQEPLYEYLMPMFPVKVAYVTTLQNQLGAGIPEHLQCKPAAATTRLNSG